MTISDVSKRYNLSQDTLRYYERIGLLPGVQRGKSGNRDYTEQDLKWVEFVKCMRGAGISVEALIEYVALFQQGEHTLQARKELLVAQRDALAERIAELQGTLNRLDSKIARYEEWTRPSEDTLRAQKEGDFL